MVVKGCLVKYFQKTSKVSRKKSLIAVRRKEDIMWIIRSDLTCETETIVSFWERKKNKQVKVRHY